MHLYDCVYTPVLNSVNSSVHFYASNSVNNSVPRSVYGYVHSSVYFPVSNSMKNSANRAVFNAVYNFFEE